jgi:tRNA pseudouridine55 synthase
MRRFEGTIEQKAPPYSAKKIQGVKYYELARKGEEVPDEPKEVTVYEFTLLDGGVQNGRLRFRLGCSSGTYARGLAHDLGLALGVGGHLAELRRTKIGGFPVEQAITFGLLEERVKGEEGIGSAWIPFDQIPLPFGEVTADPQQESRISHGQTVLVRELAGEEGDWVKLVNRRRELIAVGTVVERIGSAGVGIVQPRVVFR